MTAIFGILNGGMQLGQSSMYVEAVRSGRNILQSIKLMKNQKLRNVAMFL